MSRHWNKSKHRERLPGSRRDRRKGRNRNKASLTKIVQVQEFQSELASDPYFVFPLWARAIWWLFDRIWIFVIALFVLIAVTVVSSGNLRVVSIFSVVMVFIGFFLILGLAERADNRFLKTRTRFRKAGDPGTGATPHTPENKRRT